MDFHFYFFSFRIENMASQENHLAAKCVQMKLGFNCGFGPIIAQNAHCHLPAWHCLFVCVRVCVDQLTYLVHDNNAVKNIGSHQNRHPFRVCVCHGNQVSETMTSRTIYHRRHLNKHSDSVKIDQHIVSFAVVVVHRHHHRHRWPPSLWFSLYRRKCAALRFRSMQVIHKSNW